MAVVALVMIVAVAILTVPRDLVWYIILLARGSEQRPFHDFVIPQKWGARDYY